MSCWKLLGRCTVVVGLFLLSGCTIRSTPETLDVQGPVGPTALVLSDWHPGNAFLIDRANRLLLTNLNTAGDKADMEYEVIFPVIEDGKALIHRDKLKKTATRIKARAIYPDAQRHDPDLLRDTAILQVESVPEGVPELKIAAATPENGATVDLLVAGAKPTLIWNSTSATIKKTEMREFVGDAIRPINARMIELSLDAKLAKDVSGGPVVNKDGEVVGLVASYPAQTGPLLCVDQNELRRTLGGAYRQLASQAIDKKKFDEAIALADKSLQVAPDSALTYNERGAAYSWKNQYDKALENYNQSIKIDPTVPLVYCNRASAYSHLEKYAEAVEDCSQALRLTRNQEPRALQLRAQAYRKMNKIAEAESDEKFLGSLDLRPKK